ncbi:MAG: polysaccharide deacetylase family protein [Bacteroidetes bacterium]|nr:polysaccharide deacetylase family protein [Bacteroidota bacterium]
MTDRPLEILMRLFPEILWHFPRTEKNIYLTFDDGPSGENTDWILEQLGQFRAKATFFCLGKNVAQYPELYGKILEARHNAGNHTYSHPNALATTGNAFYEDIEKAGALIKSSLFRPPYGKLRPSQYRRLKKKFRIVMWDVLSRDFDSRFSEADCLENVTKEIKPGSVVVFHDSAKAQVRMRHALPVILREYSEKGFSFPAIPE